MGCGDAQGGGGAVTADEGTVKGGGVTACPRILSAAALGGGDGPPLWQDHPREEDGRSCNLLAASSREEEGGCRLNPCPREEEGARDSKPSYFAVP